MFGLRCIYGIGAHGTWVLVFILGFLGYGEVHIRYAGIISNLAQDIVNKDGIISTYYYTNPMLQ